MELKGGVPSEIDGGYRAAQGGWRHGAGWLASLPALFGVVEDWRPGVDGMVALSAYVYVYAQTHEHGPLGEALETLNTICAQYLDLLRSGPAGGWPRLCRGHPGS